MATRFHVVDTKTGEVLHDAATLNEAVDTINDSNWSTVKIEPVTSEEAGKEE